MIKEFFGENPKESHSMAKIINKQHLLRLKSLLKDPDVDASIVYGGSVDEDNL
jgi:aldehyde dehydrogenase (NAD+)